jgi:hypothetical protein
VNLSSGVYIINGSFSQTGSVTLTGSNITIYLAPPNGALSLTGSGALNITAPNPNDPTCSSLCAASPYTGILFYEDPNDTNAMKVGGSNGSSIKGIFYAPSATLSLAGSSGASFYTDLVVNSLSLAGTNNLHNYSAVNPNTPLTAPRVVE